MHSGKTSTLNIYKYNRRGFNKAEDLLATEEPLEIKLKFHAAGIWQEKNISITMRTPGNDAELAVGFLYTEGIIRSQADIAIAKQMDSNSICVELVENASTDLSRIERHFYTSSSCGVCGKSSIDSLRSVSHKKPFENGLVISPEMTFSMNEKVKLQQKIFNSTGGLHASALFNRDGVLLSVFEDVGRHNALDKLIGHHIMAKSQALSESILFLSGRACYELIQKAVMADIPIICALGAPSSLAVELASEFNVTLIGFLKNDGFNVYHGGGRLQGF